MLRGAEAEGGERLRVVLYRSMSARMYVLSTMPCWLLHRASQAYFRASLLLPIAIVWPSGILYFLFRMENETHCVMLAESPVRRICVVCACVCVCVFFISIVRANRLTNENTSACD